MMWTVGSLNTSSMSPLLIPGGVIKKQALIMNIYMGELGSLHSNCSLFLSFGIPKKDVFNLPGCNV